MPKPKNSTKVPKPKNPKPIPARDATTDSDHYHIGKKKYRRMTTITGLLGYKEIATIAKKYGIEYANKIMSKAGTAGNLFHSYAEKIARRELRQKDIDAIAVMDPALAGEIDIYKKYYANNVKKFIAVEQVFFCNDLMVAGAVDLVAETKSGAVALIDLKHTAKILPSHFIQLAGYDYLLRENGIYPTEFKIVRAKNGSVEVTEIPPGAIAIAKNYFFYLSSYAPEMDNLLAQSKTNKII